MIFERRHKLHCHTSDHGRHNGSAGQSLGWRDPRAVDPCTDAEGFRWMRKITVWIKSFWDLTSTWSVFQQFLQSKAGRINAALFGLVQGCWRSFLNWWEFDFLFLIFVQQVHVCRARVIQSPFAMSSSWEWESLARICCKTGGRGQSLMKQTQRKPSQAIWYALDASRSLIETQMNDESRFQPRGAFGKLWRCLFCHPRPCWSCPICSRTQQCVPLLAAKNMKGMRSPVILCFIVFHMYSIGIPAVHCHHAVPFGLWTCWVRVW